MADVRNLKAEIDEKKSCFNGWCPNWGFRYWMDTEMPIPRFFSSFETTESACNQITEALKKDSTKMVGLHGLGGVGKTTLAKSVGNQLRQQKIFDKVGIATVSQDPDIIKVQGELAKSLGWALNEKDEKERADRLRLMFSESKSSKILVILDDIWKQLDSEKKLGIPVGGRDNCCKILLTTRKKSVCDSLGCDTQIPLSTLTPEEGLALLRKNAGIDVNDSTLNDVSKEVAGECKGLPLAIEAVGSALRGKRFNEWNLALHNLKAAKLYAIEGVDEENLDVYGCLKFSYDNLNDDNSKLCFLLCSLFPEDYEINLEVLVRYVVGLTWYQAESIEHARSLLRGTIEGLKAASLLLDTELKNSICGQLFHLSDTIPALLKHGLKNWKKLGIRRLGVQVVFQLEAIIAEGQENNLFPCLKEVQLENLRELQVLYHVGPMHNFSLQSLTYLTVDGCTMLRRLFSSTFARNLLQLEALYVWNCFELEQIIDEDEDEDEDHLQPVCFPKLKRISVGYCPKLKHLFHISVAPSLQKLKYIWIIGNDELEEVFWHKDGADVTEYNEIVMNELGDLILSDLPNLINFWPAGYQIPFPSANNVIVDVPSFVQVQKEIDDSKNSGAHVNS
ncbi:hypothetical protein CUMW_263490 [Citrus unshiu]|uniref:AAA+ ATPase domain-containing protein n=1 Tax=Citrus unshiu TaxID=55188 RepID=A0A2H5QUQ2_CITUN|nr:hypothetical protein CUMW_263490 [Citrus unshiu]